MSSGRFCRTKDAYHGLIPFLSDFGLTPNLKSVKDHVFRISSYNTTLIVGLHHKNNWSKIITVKRPWLSSKLSLSNTLQVMYCLCLKYQLCQAHHLHYVQFYWDYVTVTFSSAVILLEVFRAKDCYLSLPKNSFRRVCGKCTTSCLAPSETD